MTRSTVAATELQPTPAVPRPLPLDGWHRARGARMVPFAGYSMPMQYEGIIAEHLWTRTHAGLFDVSHMGQLTVDGSEATGALEALMPADLAALKSGRVRYSLLLAENGGILDDLMVTNIGKDGEGPFRLVVNGATKHDDIAHLRANLPDAVGMACHFDHALLALQGPEAAAVLDELLPGIADDTAFMQAVSRDWNGTALLICRAGYTGEDGFEISLPEESAAEFADSLMADDRVKPVGLGARDSLRLEAGLPLYGHDIDTSTDPVSAGLAFAISRRRRDEGGFPGSDNIARMLAESPPRSRVGLLLDGRVPAREGAGVSAGGEVVGQVTSGGFAPSVESPIAMAYVRDDVAKSGTEVTVNVRGRELPARVVDMPFVPHNYRRQGGK
ncbi:glycine cleavage system aminomethyltransferase GcvT [Aurantiacibacter poecillastricola]|uniref:glycine cleavage system aminomethyltransferase GcvT n=1 Tax=Aurantiacibacter poecillastricola TaxID=3064385 RepID=UPI00273E23DC|nr:glycine cleavage system aminomethyltransferase GcvT [Aurantiacibacter sp. 219JJ12-13]MDP5262404.1 glycine cleavage system aminomethyltransferase GcvT [Aurantiacibacter sp. 219JJ12-13]